METSKDSFAQAKLQLLILIFRHIIISVIQIWLSQRHDTCASYLPKSELLQVIFISLLILVQDLKNLLFAGLRHWKMIVVLLK